MAIADQTPSRRGSQRRRHRRRLPDSIETLRTDDDERQNRTCAAAGDERLMSPSPPSNDDKTVRKGRRPFERGNRFGRGRPAGSRNNATLALDQIAAGEAESVLRQVLQQALAGDLRAAEMLMARIWPVKRGRPVRLQLPAIDTAAGVAAALGALIEAVAAGDVTPEEAAPVGPLLETKRRAIETVELEERLRVLEEKSGK